MIARQRQPGEPKIIPNGEPVIEYEAQIGAIVKFSVLVDEGQGYVERQFEKYVRAPGTRIIAVKENKILLQKELRTELSGGYSATGGPAYGWDWRLPGGKVIDSFQEYKQYFGKEIPEAVILDAARRELREEAGLEAVAMKILNKKVCGTTVEWDLYYILASGVSEHKPERKHNEGEDVVDSRWFSFDEVHKMCHSGEIGEGRTVAALVQFITRQK